jgi:Mg2+-importing ATPase
VIITLILGLTDIAYILDMSPLPYTYILWLVILMVVYLVITQIIKNIFISRYEKWI